MRKIINYLCTAIIVLTLFSCDKKNEWTPEKEKEFKDLLKKELETSGKDVFTDEQINYVSDCIFEKMKSKNVKPNDTETSENTMMAMQMGRKCAEEALSNTKIDAWSPELELQCKETLKDIFLESGVNSSNASFLADCAITKIKEQNIRPTDFHNAKMSDIIQKIGKSCGEELMKKK